MYIINISNDNNIIIYNLITYQIDFVQLNPFHSFMDSLYSIYPKIRQIILSKVYYFVIKITE